MEDAVIGQMESIIDRVDQFMRGLSDGLEQINANIDQLTDKSMKMIDDYIKPMVRDLGRTNFADIEEAKCIEMR